MRIPPGTAAEQPKLPGAQTLPRQIHKTPKRLLGEHDRRGTPIRRIG
jgi:hypothetical protein